MISIKFKEVIGKIDNLDVQQKRILHTLQTYKSLLLQVLKNSQDTNKSLAEQKEQINKLSTSLDHLQDYTQESLKDINANVSDLKSQGSDTSQQTKQILQNDLELKKVNQELIHQIKIKDQEVHNLEQQNGDLKDQITKMGEMILEMQNKLLHAINKLDKDKKAQDILASIGVIVNDLNTSASEKIDQLKKLMSSTS
jgi:predicted  nucleic acid-binding Zn-ribbon protein